MAIRTLVMLRSVVVAEEESILDAAKVLSECDASYCWNNQAVIEQGYRTYFFREDSPAEAVVAKSNEIMIDFQQARTPYSAMIAIPCYPTPYS